MIIDFKIFEKKGNVVGPLYHGSRYLFDTFRHHKLGSDKHPLSYLGYHFTPDEKIARKFSKDPDFALYEVEITVNKVLKIKESNLVKSIIKYGYEHGHRYLNRINDINYILKLPYMSFGEDSINGLLFDDDIWDSSEVKRISKEYKNYLIQLGYDSIKYLNEVEYHSTPDRYDWIVFNSKQIKIIKKDRIIRDTVNIVGPFG